VEPEVAEGADPGIDVAELAARAAQADEYLALAQRTKADFENFRRRAQRDAAAAQERGALKLVHSLLPAIDNLDRALDHVDATLAGSDGESPDGGGTASLVAGLRHVRDDVIAAFGRAGIEVFDPVGEPFDPQYHEAVAQRPVAGIAPGIVVEVFQRGYRLGETVVRPARVVVAG
jgi:molecular chaperone GrpE